jgi:hypothetical protein
MPIYAPPPTPNELPRDRVTANICTGNQLLWEECWSTNSDHFWSFQSLNIWGTKHVMKFMWVIKCLMITVWFWFYVLLLCRLCATSVTIHSSFLFIDITCFGLATGYRLDDRGVGVRVSVGLRIFSSPVVHAGSGADRASYLVGRGAAPEVNWQGPEADHSPPTSAEVKKMWIYNPLPHTPSWRSA